MAFGHYASADLDCLQIVCPLLPMINDDAARPRGEQCENSHSTGVGNHKSHDGWRGRGSNSSNNYPPLVPRIGESGVTVRNIFVLIGRKVQLFFFFFLLSSLLQYDSLYTNLT